MSERRDGGAAYVMPLRDWFAGQAVAGGRAAQGYEVRGEDLAKPMSWFIQQEAAAAYAYADAMLAEREKEVQRDA